MFGFIRRHSACYGYTMATRRRAHGDGSLYYSETRNRWEAWLELPPSEDGKRRRARITARTQKEAAAKLRDARARVEAGASASRAHLTVGAFLDEWLASIAGSVAVGTHENYADVARIYIKPAIGRHRLASLTPRHVEKMTADIIDRGLSPRTASLSRAVLRRALTRAVREGLVVRNVAALAEAPRREHREGRTLTVDEARRLLDGLSGERLGAAIATALAVGLRRGEVLGLRWSDIDFRKGTLSVRRQLVRTERRGLELADTKTGSQRLIHLPEGLAVRLKKHRRQQEAERAGSDVWSAEWPGLVFTTEIGTPVDPDYFTRLTQRVTSRVLGETWSPHALRHSAASILLAQGVPLKSISELLGHSGIGITADIYSHVLAPLRDEVASTMSKALFADMRDSTPPTE